MSVPVVVSAVVASSTTPGFVVEASSAVTVTSPVAPLTSIPSPATIDVTLAAVFATGKTPVTSAVKSIPSSFMVTAPEDTEKLSELKLAAPLAEVLASAKFIVTAPEEPPPVRLVPAVTPVISPAVVL